MSQRKLRLTMTAAELLKVAAERLFVLAEVFPELDLAFEAEKCCAYWNDHGGFKTPLLAYMNWLEVAERRRTQPFSRNGHSDSTGMTRGAPPQDREEFLRDYERRRGLTA